MQKIFKENIIEQLRQQITVLEGHKQLPTKSSKNIGLNFLDACFPQRVFPTGVIHEFLSEEAENLACTTAFIGGLLAKINPKNSFYIWIGNQKKVFPAGLKVFGLQPHQIIFISLAKQKDILWATEEALKCKSVQGVISELESISFAQSQRLQLTIEKSNVTCYILRTNNQTNATTCTARWQISPQVSYSTDAELPGIGFANWKVELLKVRNGTPTSFNVAWLNGQFTNVAQIETARILRKAMG
ncbi:MAG: Error-prone repair protein ImuA [Flavobacterium sp.]|nr:MAG: Error-prone repair protein ImuA [Flavobacterium sp.]